jgi:hypothetical protein
MGAGLLAVKSGFILFIKSYQFPLQINTLEREREPKIRGIKKCRCDERLQTKTKEFTRLPYTGLNINS